MSEKKSNQTDKTLDDRATLLNIRDSISELDDTLISLLAKRREFSLIVAKAKQSIDKPLRDLVREKELLESLIERASDLGLESNYVTRIFTTIIKDSVRYQQQYLQSKLVPSLRDHTIKSIAVLGGIGAYSHLAAKAFFCKSENNYSACSSFKEIIDKVESGETQFGVIPIENTTSGGITEVYDLLLKSKLNIIGEEKFEVNHCLVSKPNNRLKDIRSIVAHPQASRQCSENLAKLVSAKIELVESTAHALEIASEKDNTDVAAISSEQAAELFGLSVLKKNLANQHENFTRFLVLSREKISVSLAVQCKTTVALSTGQKPGSLAQVLTLFQDAQIPLSKLESRPIPDKPWEQMFYIDLEGNVGDPVVAKAFDTLTKTCRYLRVFGSYPTEDITPTQVSPASLAKASLNRSKQSEADKDSEHLIKGPATSYRTEEIRHGSNLRTSRAHKLQDSIVDLNGTKIGSQDFIVIAGPSRIESEEQINACAKLAKETGISLLSGGCFDHRTSVDHFKVLDKHGLERLSQASKHNDQSIVVEVFDNEQIKSVVRFKGIIKIGEQNMRNYSLLDSISRLDVPVFITCANGASLEEFLEVAEYVLAQGNLQLVLCLRAYSSHDKTLNSAVDLSNVIKLKQLTHLPVVLDLTKSLDSKTLVAPLALAAKSAGADGVFIEFNDQSLGLNFKDGTTLNHLQVSQLMSDLHPSK